MMKANFDSLYFTQDFIHSYGPGLIWGGWGSVTIGGGGGNAKRESPDLRSPEVGISKVLLLMSLLTITICKPKFLYKVSFS